MQKLREASDKNKGDACTKKRDRPDKRKNLISLSAATCRGITPC